MTPTSTVPEVQVQQIPLDKIDPSPFNPRKTFPKDYIAELAASISAQGLQSPVKLRRLFGGPGSETERYELVFGECRWRAAKQAGLRVIPAIVEAMTSERALELQLIENLQRKDISSLEEAEGFAELAKTLSAKEIGARVGKSDRYVYDSLNLVRLAVAAKKLLLEGGIARTHAVLLSVLPAVTQQKVIDDGILEPDYDGVISSDDLKERLIEDYYRNLKDAPWDLADEQLDKKAGSCMKCPKRTGNMAGCEPKKGNLCTDPVCFTTKFAAFVQLLETSQRTIAVSRERKPYDRGEAIAHVLYDGEYTPVPKTAKECSATRGCQVVEGKDVGTKLRACVASSCPAHKKAGEDNYAAQSRRWAKQQRERDARCKVDLAVSERLVSEVYARADRAVETRKLAVWPLVARVLFDSLPWEARPICTKVLTGRAPAAGIATLPKMSPKDLQKAALLFAVAPAVVEDPDSDEAKKVFAATGIDAKALEKEVRDRLAPKKKAKAAAKGKAKVSKTPARRGSQAPASKRGAAKARKETAAKAKRKPAKRAPKRGSKKK